MPKENENEVDLNELAENTKLMLSQTQTLCSLLEITNKSLECLRQQVDFRIENIENVIKRMGDVEDRMTYVEDMVIRF